MMKIAITGEGNTDYGKKEYGTGKWLPGPAIIYVEKIAKEQGMNVELLPIEKQDVMKVRVQGRSTKGLSGRGIPAKKFMILKNKNKCDAGIFYCDADKGTGTKSSNCSAVAKHYEEVYEEVKNGLSSDQAIPMIPLSMIECWMLGDKAALEQIFHLSISERKLPDKPEYVWGAKTDPNSDYPKNYFVRLIRSLDRRYGTYQSCQEDFNKIADHSTISTLRKTCPLSYERFYTDFINLLKNVDV
ncbi:MAG: DUF4276 family protein [Eubacterium sp.]|nr:DUF4276 family protein [Eubacterium sp.]